MKKVMIYPFGKDSELIAKYPKQLVGLEPVCFVGLKGWEHFYDNIVHSFKVEFDFEKALKEYRPDVVWFVKFSKNLDFDKYYLPYIKMVTEKNIQLIIDPSVNQKIDNTTKNRIDFYNPERYLHIEGEEIGEVLYPIIKPVIYISNFYGELNKTDVLLQIREKLDEYNINAKYVSVNYRARFFGIYNISDTILRNDISDQKKVIIINNCLKTIAESKRTDLIIVSVPGEMFCVSNKFLANMGFLTYDFFTAARPDILICNLPYSSYTEKDINHLNYKINQRFGVNVDIFLRTNKRLLVRDTEMEQQYSYLTIAAENIHKLQSIDNVYDYQETTVSQIVNKCLEKLYEYGEVDMI